MNRDEAKEIVFGGGSNLLKTRGEHEIDGMVFKRFRVLEFVDKIYDDFENRICETCVFSSLFPVDNMICQRGGYGYNPLFEVKIEPDFGCNKWKK